MRSILLAGAAGFFMVSGAQAADQAADGAIVSASGEKLGGVTVSAKREGSTITTSVYTDETGNYYFPPLRGGKISRSGRRRSVSKPPRARSISRPRTITISASSRSRIADALIASFPASCWSRRCPRNSGRRRHQEDLHQQLHRLPCARLSASVQVRRSRLEQNHRPDEGRTRRRRLSGTGAKASQIIEHNQKRARGLSRARARTRTDLDEVHDAPASDRRSRPRRMDAL